MNLNLFGEIVTPTPTKTRAKKTQKQKPPATPKPRETQSSIPKTTKVIEVEQGDINAKYEVGDRIEYKFPQSAGGHWEEGILLAFYNPKSPKETKQTDVFSFIEIEINGVIRKAYSLYQIRKAQVYLHGKFTNDI